MPTTTWDATFEASPTDSDEAKYGANEIRELKTAISERLELEMNFKTGSQPLIKAGQAAVCATNTTAQIANIANMSNGALVWDSTIKTIKRYNGASWATLDADHGALSGLTDDDHTQYLKLDKANQTLAANLAVTANLTVDGRDISVDGTAFDAHIAGNAANQHANGVGIVLGTWDDTKVANTAYLAATDGLVLATSLGITRGYTDSANPPTTEVIESWGSGSQSSGITMPVKKGHYWKVTMTGATVAIYWLPIGS